MSESIHRKGSGPDARYRFWYSIPDAYGAEPMTRAEMAQHIDGSQSAADIEARLVRADANGTSTHGQTRDTSEWDTERCSRCDNFHHDYDPDTAAGANGPCRSCGESRRDKAHKPPCATEVPRGDR